VQDGKLPSLEVLGNNRWQSQETRLELGLRLTCGLSRANDLNCERHRYGKRFVGRADEKLTAFVELDSLREKTYRCSCLAAL
jgi:hypothetical protein